MCSILRTFQCQGDVGKRVPGIGGAKGQKVRYLVSSWTACSLVGEGEESLLQLVTSWWGGGS